MRSELMVLLAYLMIVAVAAGIYTLLELTSGESMVLSILLLIGIMYAGGKASAFLAAVIVYGILAAAGVLLFLLCCRRKKEFFSVYLFLLTVLFAGSTIAFHGDFIQKIDDFHQWAAAVKYMLETGHLPVEGDFLGVAGMPMFTSVFHLFFQKLGGYNEGNMYASSVLLSAAAILLPLCRISWKNFPKAFLYALTVYAGLFSLYLHPYKSLYVDLPAAAWAAAVCVWFAGILKTEKTPGIKKAASSANGSKAGTAQIRKTAGAAEYFGLVRSRNRRQKLGRALFLVCSLLFTVEIKLGIGLLLAGFAFIYVIVDYWISLEKAERRRLVKRYGKICLLILIILAAAFIIAWLTLGSRLVPVSMDGVKEALLLSSDKARKTFVKLLRGSIFKQTLGGYSSYTLKPLPAAACFTFLALLLAGFTEGRDRRHMIWDAIFLPASFLLYTAALYITYVSTFSYEESVGNAAVHRYLSTIILFLFFIAAGDLFLLAEPEEKGRRRILKVMELGMCVFFLLGLNKNFVPAASHFRTWKLGSYKVIKTAKEDTARLDQLAGKDARVYLLVQNMDLTNVNEFAMCTPLYYREHAISNYLKEPWNFNEEGSYTLLSRTAPRIEDFPAMLESGGYSYLWLRGTDEDPYIRKELPKNFIVDGKVKDGLYQITYGGEKPELTYVSED